MCFSCFWCVFLAELSHIDSMAVARGPGVLSVLTVHRHPASLPLAREHWKWQACHWHLILFTGKSKFTLYWCEKDWRCYDISTRVTRWVLFGSRSAPPSPPHIKEQIPVLLLGWHPSATLFMPSTLLRLCWGTRRTILWRQARVCHPAPPVEPEWTAAPVSRYQEWKNQLKTKKRTRQKPSRKGKKGTTVCG